MHKHNHTKHQIVDRMQTSPKMLVLNSKTHLLLRVCKIKINFYSIKLLMSPSRNISKRDHNTVAAGSKQTRTELVLATVKTEP